MQKRAVFNNFSTILSTSDPEWLESNVAACYHFPLEYGHSRGVETGGGGGGGGG